MAKVLDILGYQVFRGSSSRGGARGLLKLVKAVKAGSQGALAVDGPRGPLHEVKPGIADLAIRTNVPLIGVRVRAFSSWTFDSTWNKCYLPKPFSRIQVVFAEAIDLSALERDSSKNEQNERVCEQVKIMLDTVLEKNPPISKQARAS